MALKVTDLQVFLQVYSQVLLRLSGKGWSPSKLRVSRYSYRYSYKIPRYSYGCQVRVGGPPSYGSPGIPISIPIDSQVFLWLSGKGWWPSRLRISRYSYRYSYKIPRYSYGCQVRVGGPQSYGVAPSFALSLLVTRGFLALKVTALPPALPPAFSPAFCHCLGSTPI